MKPLAIFLVLSCTLALVACKTSGADSQALDEERPAHHLADGTFQNIYIGPIEKEAFTFLKMRFFGDEPFADQEAEAYKVPISEPNYAGLNQPVPAPQVTWLGHSTFLLQYQGLNVLTDPILSNRASPVSFAGPKRLVQKPIEHKHLPTIDYVVISHNHYDHLDLDTIAALKDEARFLVPLKLKNWFVEQGVAADKIVEFDWWDARQFGPLKVTATPSQHWSRRGLFDTNTTLWAAWHLEFAAAPQTEGFSTWFAGDTGYNPHQFKEVATKLGAVDLGLIPIGAYAPRWFMGPMHINPEEAVKMHLDVGAKKSIGMHWGTFQLTAEPIMEPKQRLKTAAEQAKLEEDEFTTLAIGETYVFDAG